MSSFASYRSKIISLEELASISDSAQQAGNRRVLCHGKFEVMHPGHTRHLEWARRQGDLLLVTLAEDTADWNSSVPLEVRLENLAALSMVDFVASVNSLDATASIHALQPDILVRGQEFRTLRRTFAEREKRALELYGGELLFSSGTPGHDNGGEEALSDARQKALLQLFERRDLRVERMEHVLNRLANLSVGVIGDCIVDEYIFCDPLGMSAEDPIIVVHPRKTEKYIGGAAIVGEHARALGAEAHYFTVVGDDATADFVTELGEASEATYHIHRDSSRPTTVKQRFIASGKKLLRVSYLEERPISDRLANTLVADVARKMPSLDLIIFSDFNYGVNCPLVREQICKLARQHGVRITADVQCSSQIATITKYSDIDLVTPTEREARMSFWDMESGLVDLGQRILQHTRNKDLIIKLGANGLMTLHGQWKDGELHDVDTEYLPSFADEARDPLGAGDALLAAASLALAADATVYEASVLGNVAAALAVQKVGNLPVNSLQVEGKLTKLLEPMLDVRA